MIIRNVRIEDIPAITDIQIGGWLTAYKGIISDEDLEKVKNSRAERIARHTGNYQSNGFIVAENDGEIVGFCRYIDNNSFSPDFDVDCELTALYVKPDCKRQGIGKALINYVKDEFRKHGKKRMILWCLRDNYPSRAFYETMGGKLAERGKDFDLDGHKYPEAGFIYEL